ncbi:sulfite exporter TauE/SafE family protein [Chloroflexota bacterium]
MSFFREWGRFMYAGAVAHAYWDKDVSTRILGSRKRLFLLGLFVLPIFIGGYACADEITTALPDMLGGEDAYGPIGYTAGIFAISIVVGLLAGLITGCIGAGGGFIIGPALMSVGVRGIMAVGTDLFHIFAKAIMGTTLHGKMGNIAVRLAMVFVVGSVLGATFGGLINRKLYETNPILSDAFITTVYVVILASLGAYAMSDFLKSRKRNGQGEVHQGTGTEEIGKLPMRIQSITIPPMITFDQNVTASGRKVSWIFLICGGVLVGFTASIMGVGGGFLFFPMFVYGLGVSAATTVGTDVFQIVFTAGYAAIGQYAIYGFIFYSLAVGMLLGSLVGIQIGAVVTKVVSSMTIRGFYATAILAGATNRIFALPGKLGKMDILPISESLGNALDTTGTVLFFVVIGGFGIWVIGTFLRNIRTLRGEVVRQ